MKKKRLSLFDLLKSIEKFWTVSNTISLLKKLKLFNRLK